MKIREMSGAFRAPKPTPEAPRWSREDLDAITRWSGTIPWVITRTGSGNVTLTFDDGPDPDHTPILLELLARHQVRAMFFLVGRQAEQHPQLVRDIVAGGHVIGNHTWKHDDELGLWSEEDIRADLRRTHDAIVAAAPGVEIRYFRHPAGRWTPRAVAVAADMGMACVGWDVDPNDWDTETHAAGDPMRDHVLSVLRGQITPGAIVLSHDAGGDRTGTLAAYTIALPELVNRFAFATL